MIGACTSRVASSAVRLQGRRYLEMNGAPPSKSSSSRLFSAAGLSLLLIGGGAAYLTMGASADPRKLKETEDRLKARLGVAQDSQAAADAKPSSKGALSSSEFRNFKLEKITPYNHDSAIFRFKLPEGEDSGLTVASALLTRAADEKTLVDDKGKAVMRPYTPITAPSERGSIDLLVKKYKGGKMTEHIHALKPGQELAMKGPLPKFPWKANQFETIALIGGGSGVTPLWQVLQEIDANPEDKTKAILIYSNKTEKDILLKEEFDKLAKNKPDQFQVVYSVDKPDSKAWKGETGFLSADLLKHYLPLPGMADKIKLFVCGPPGQVEAVCGAKKSPKDQGELKGALADLGYQSSQIYKF